MFARVVRLATRRGLSPSATISLMSRTVLIVDDHPSFRASARAMLEAEGFDVVGELTEGASVVETVLALEPDVVLLDVQLPDMTGFDVCAKLETCDASTVQVILVSSRDLTDYGELVDVSCACGFVPKGELSGDLVSALLA
jgi:DNA-binding NarL/FixJ family response regulator